MAKVTMPQLGESVAEGTIGRWLKQPGDTVAKYEPLVEVITDKVNAEVPSPFAGVLREILAEEGTTVPNNAEIAVIETAEEAGGSSAAASVAAPDRCPRHPRRPLKSSPSPPRHPQRLLQPPRRHQPPPSRPQRPPPRRLLRPPPLRPRPQFTTRMPA